LPTTLFIALIRRVNNQTIATQDNTANTKKKIVKTRKQNNQSLVIQDNTANPAPLGLMGFGMTTVLLNIHNVDAMPLNSMILAMGLFYGGLGQVIVGILEWKKNNTFGMVAFGSYGLFWLTLVALVVMPKLGLGEATSKQGMGWYLVMWGIFTAVLMVASFKHNKALITVFVLLTALFFLLAAGDFTGNKSITIFAGWEGILTGFSAIYLGAAQIINEAYGKTVLPID